jgi:hypothetical protein
MDIRYNLTKYDITVDATAQDAVYFMPCGLRTSMSARQLPRDLQLAGDT